MHKIALLTSALLLASATGADAAVLYATTAINSSVRISDYGQTSQSGFRTFDDFVIATDGSVQTVSWRGLWIDLGSPDPAPAPLPDVLTWEVAFYADAGGAPGAQLSSQSFGAATVTSTLLGTGLFSAGNTYNVAYYDYSVDLPTAFAVDAGTTYWLSVFSRSDLAQPAFAWRGAIGGDEVSIQQQLGANLSVLNTSLVSRDRAFTLEGTVPEPASILLLATGAAALLRRRRRAV